MTRILLIDSHPLLRGAIRRSLKHAGLNLVGEVQSVDAGRDWLVKATADVLVLGTEPSRAVEGVKALLEGGEQHAVVVVTRHRDPQLLAALRAAGALGVLGTGSEEGDLARTCESVAQGRPVVCPTMGLGKPESSVSLTRREAEVLQCVAEGGTTRSIGEVLEISAKTVDTHRQNIMRKLNLRTVAELTKHAVRIGITSL